MTKPETDVNPGAGKPDDAGEDDEGAIAKDNEPVTEIEKSLPRVYRWRKKEPLVYGK